MSGVVIILFLCGAALVGVSIILFCYGCETFITVKEDYGSSDDPHYMDSLCLRRTVRALIISYALLFFGALAFVGIFMLR